MLPAMSAAPSPNDVIALNQMRERLIAEIRHQAVGQLPADPTDDGSRPDFDPGENSPSNWTGRTFLLRTQALAAAGRHEPARRSLHWWNQHDPLSTNWWHNQIGTPRLVAETLLLLPDNETDDDLLQLARRVLDRSGDFLLSQDGTVRTPQRWTGANQLWMCINRLYAAVLFRDPVKIPTAIDEAMREVYLAHVGEEGIQVDGSFHQHGPLLYNGGYGRAFLEDCCLFFAATRGTPWQPPEHARDLLTGLLLDGTRWMLRGEHITPACMDRNITREQPDDIAFIATAADILADPENPRADELHNLAEAVRRKAAPGSLAGNRMFYRSDCMVQHFAEASMTVRMHSARTKSAESINGEGLRSHHLADGLTWLLRTGAEYRGIYPAWDWQRLPGTTCALTTDPEPTAEVGRPSSATAVGGVSDGAWGACTQHLVNDRLSIRKSWFFGPGAMVCLGTGLRAETGLPVVTTLDQSLLQGPVTIDEERAPLVAGRHTLAGVSRLVHGPWRFEFPTPAEVVVEIGPRTGSWSDIGSGSEIPVTLPVFLACIRHATSPENNGYAYAVRTDENAPVYEVVQNTVAAQALHWPEAGLLQAVFHEPGELSFAPGLVLRVSGIASVQLTAEDKGDAIHWRLVAADTGQTGEKIQVALLDEETGRLLAEGQAAPPAGDFAGRTFRIF